MLQGGRNGKGPTNVLNVGGWGPAGKEELRWPRTKSQTQAVFGLLKCQGRLLCGEGVLEAQRRQGAWPRLNSRSTAEAGLTPRIPVASLGGSAGEGSSSLRKKIPFQEAAQHSRPRFSWLRPVLTTGTGKILQLLCVLISSWLNRESNEVTFRNPLVAAGHIVRTQCMSAPVL